MKKKLTAADMHDPQVIAETPWFSMRKVGIDVAPGERRDFYSIYYPRPAVGIVAIQDEKVLLIRHYRYLIDKVVWAIPSGGVDEGEDPAVAALRELREETGWQAQRVEEIIRFNPSYGSSDQLFITWLATGLRWVGMDADQDEVMETGWFTFDEINQLIARGEMPDGLSLVPLLQLMAQRRSGEAARLRLKHPPAEPQLGHEDQHAADNLLQRQLFAVPQRGGNDRQQRFEHHDDRRAGHRRVLLPLHLQTEAQAGSDDNAGHQPAESRQGHRLVPAFNGSGDGQPDDTGDRQLHGGQGDQRYFTRAAAGVTEPD